MNRIVRGKTRSWQTCAPCVPRCSRRLAPTFVRFPRRSEAADVLTGFRMSEGVRPWPEKGTASQDLLETTTALKRNDPIYTRRLGQDSCRSSSSPAPHHAAIRSEVSLTNGAEPANLV